MLRLRENAKALEIMLSRAAVDLEAAQAKIDKLTMELNEQTAARAVAEQAVSVLSVTNSQMQTRIDKLQTELNAQIANGQAVYAAQKAALATQTEETREAEKRAIAAEVTAASLSLQVNELKATIEQLCALRSASVPFSPQGKRKIRIFRHLRSKCKISLLCHAKMCGNHVGMLKGTSITDSTGRASGIAPSRSRWSGRYRIPPRKQRHSPPPDGA